MTENSFYLQWLVRKLKYIRHSKIFTVVPQGAYAKGQQKDEDAGKTFLCDKREWVINYEFCRDFQYSGLSN